MNLKPSPLFLQMISSNNEVFDDDDDDNDEEDEDDVRDSLVCVTRDCRESCDPLKNA